MKIAIVGAGWAGLAAAVEATQAGHQTTVFEAAHAVGGRARVLQGHLADATPVALDNGQHILIGAYTQTLRLMELVGVDTRTSLLRLPLCLQFPDGNGLALPRWPSPLDALGGMLGARGWSLADKWSLLRAALGWQLAGFRCERDTSVAMLCAGLSTTVLTTLIDPLCVAALNTPSARASGQVFLRVLQDSLFGGQGSSNLLLPTTDLTRLFPQAATEWLQTHGSQVRLAARVTSLQRTQDRWLLEGEPFDAVIWATSAAHAAAALVQFSHNAPDAVARPMRQWAATAQALRFEAIATVYAHAAGVRLAQPMLALASDATRPAQFVFDRGQLGGPQGLLALVVSASERDRELLQTQVLAQAHEQLAQALQGRALVALQTVVEKRATFACTPALVRPSPAIAPALWACGDYVDGPYPATLEGAVRSGIAAALALTS